MFIFICIFICVYIYICGTVAARRHPRDRVHGRQTDQGVPIAQGVHGLLHGLYIYGLGAHRLVLLRLVPEPAQLVAPRLGPGRRREARGVLEDGFEPSAGDLRCSRLAQNTLHYLDIA